MSSSWGRAELHEGVDAGLLLPGTGLLSRALLTWSLPITRETMSSELCCISHSSYPGVLSLCSQISGLNLSVRLPLSILLPSSLFYTGTSSSIFFFP